MDIGLGLSRRCRLLAEHSVRAALPPQDIVFESQGLRSTKSSESRSAAPEAAERAQLSHHQPLQNPVPPFPVFRRTQDQLDEAEQVGTFSVASEEVLKNRAIKKSKCRNVGFESDSGGTFKGFKGLVVPSGGGQFPGFGSSAGGKPLEGLSKGNDVTSAPPFTSARAAAEPKVAFGSLAANGPTALVEKKVSNPKTNGDSQQPSSSGLASSKACVRNAYHKQLAALNCSVWDWIVKHVNTNPLCDLMPIFKYYEKYLANIEQQHGNGGRNSESESNKTAVETQSLSLFGSTKLQQESMFLFHSNKTDDTPGKKVEVAIEKKTDPSLGATSASFNFGKKVDSSVVG
ncbi:Nuclear pore complex protein Nup50 [Saguinus oedipus]|uniref:Nuclear pore complex protein Nup50 n=1 Tax=Saguinus oedipus TaxID=9490 RepID=A0ABQ9TFF3_SAGOE|nr:Nuclear pore complex protein Nup50 [Saguinus oedipus]